MPSDIILGLVSVMSEAAKRIYVYPEFTHTVTERHDTDVAYVRADLVDELIKALSAANDLITLNRAIPRISTAVQEHVQAVLDAMKEER